MSLDCGPLLEMNKFRLQYHAEKWITHVAKLPTILSFAYRGQHTSQREPFGAEVEAGVQKLMPLDGLGHAPELLDSSSSSLVEEGELYAKLA